jgi:hypothetical protein
VTRWRRNERTSGLSGIGVGRAARWALAACCALTACTSAWNEGPPPYTPAETNNALRPVKEIERRCYEGSESQKQKLVVQLDFTLYVNERGEVRSEPVGGDLAPDLIECVRTGLDTLKFPGKGEADQIHLDVQLGK